MTKYKYEELGKHGEEITVIITEDQIIAKFWDYWTGQMIKVGKEDEISRGSCIDDFIAENWAYEIE